MFTVLRNLIVKTKDQHKASNKAVCGQLGASNVNAFAKNHFFINTDKESRKCNLISTENKSEFL